MRVLVGGGGAHPQRDEQSSSGEVVACAEACEKPAACGGVAFTDELESPRQGLGVREREVFLLQEPQRDVFRDSRELLGS
jgi:hypothetical protein